MKLVIALPGGGDEQQQEQPSPSPSSDKSEKTNSPIVADVMEDVSEAFEDVSDFIEDKFEDIAALVHKSALAGKLFPVLSKFLISPAKAKAIWKAVRETVPNPYDLIFVAAVGWATVPVLEYPYDRLLQTDDDDNAPTVVVDEPVSVRDVAQMQQQPKTKKFRNTLMFQFADHISQAAKLAVLVYAADVVNIIIEELGFKIQGLENMSQGFAQIIYSIWIAQRISKFKLYFIGRTIADNPDNLGRASIVDHLLDAVLISVLILYIAEVLHLHGGLALKSLFAIGGAGTLTLSLASKDIASQLISGLVVSASDKIYEGDECSFDDGPSGKVVKMGWMETTVRLPDETFVSIPNNQLSQKRLVNYSRLEKCQVKQTLIFSNEDVDRLPSLLRDIRDEIRRSCPTLITDGTRPFRVFWSNYKENDVEVTVDCRFRTKPKGDEYHINKQNTLMAIHRAVAKNNMKLPLLRDV